MRAWDRGNMGSGHGWSGAVQVFWNALVTGERAASGELQDLVIDSPAGASNYGIGCVSDEVGGGGHSRQLRLARVPEEPVRCAACGADRQPVLRVRRHEDVKSHAGAEPESDPVPDAGSVSEPDRSAESEPDSGPDLEHRSAEPEPDPAPHIEPLGQPDGVALRGWEKERPGDRRGLRGGMRRVRGGGWLFGR